MINFNDIDNDRGSNNWFFVGLDDSNIIFDASLEKRPDNGLPIIHNLLSNVRKSRINILACSQTPHQLGASIHSNSCIQITMKLSNGRDIEFMQKSMGNFTREQKDYCYTLPERQMIIKNSCRYPPTLGIIPEIPESREISDEEVSINNTRILSNFPPIVPRYDPKTEVNETKTSETSETTDKTTATEKSMHAEINDKTKEYLMVLNISQLKKTITETYKLAGLPLGTGNRIYQYCEKNNLVKTMTVKLGRGSPKYPLLMPEAYKILGIKEKKFYGRGAGPEHILWQHLIAERFSKFGDCRVKIEYMRGGKAIDVAILTNEFIIAIEVAMTSDHVRENIEKDLKAGAADFVITACRDTSVMDKVSRVVSEMPEQFRDKTAVMLLSGLLAQEPAELFRRISNQLKRR